MKSYDLTGSFVDCDKHLKGNLEKFSINNIVIDEIFGYVDEFDGGDIEVYFSNNWTMQIKYHSESILTVSKQDGEQIYTSSTPDCFSGLGILGDIRYALQNTINLVLNIK